MVRYDTAVFAILICVCWVAPAAAQPGSLKGYPVVPGAAERARAVGGLMSGAGRAKFRRPGKGAPVVDKEYIVTFKPDTPTAVVDEAARQVAASTPGVEWQLLGNQPAGWRGLAFKVPPGHAAGQTAALLDGLLALPQTLAGEANEFVSLYRPVPEPEAAAAAAVEPAAAAATSASDPAAAVVEPAATPAAAGQAAAAGVAAATDAPSAQATAADTGDNGGPVSAASTTCFAYTAGAVTLRPLATSAAGGNVPTNGLWGLERVESRGRVYNGAYGFSANGTDVNVFVVDTGVQTDHPELAGRVTMAFTRVNDGLDAADGNGHGTHCAGTIGGLQVGVAPGVRIHSVRVLDSSGMGTFADVIAGMDHVTAAAAVPRRIMSMSLGGSRSTAINSAVDRAVRSGVLVVVAAGNENADACRTSPASSANAVTVAASDINDARAWFSNRGSCVDIFAPGVNIYSAVPPNNYDSLSGTSMAAPHVAGVAARLWSKGACSSAATCASALRCLATPNAVSNAGSRTTTALAFIPQDV